MADMGGRFMTPEMIAAQNARVNQQTNIGQQMGGSFMTPEMIAAQQAQQPATVQNGAVEMGGRLMIPPVQTNAATAGQPAITAAQPIDVANLLAQQGPVNASGAVRPEFDASGQYEIVNGQLRRKLNL